MAIVIKLEDSTIEMLRALSVPCPLDIPAGSTLHDTVSAPASKWFFDKSVWQKMFRMYDSCNLNGMVLAYNDPFPALVDTRPDADAENFEDDTLTYSSSVHRWILDNAAAYQIAVYLKFTLDAESDMVYVCRCLRRVLESYPEFRGVVVNLRGTWSKLQEVVAVIDAVRPDASLCVAPDHELGKSTSNLPVRKHSRETLYIIPYTDQYMVDAKPDKQFKAWVEAIGAENVVADFPLANFHPWTSFSYETAEEALEYLTEIGVRGFNIWPLSIAEFPRTSDSVFTYQWQRDMVWYAIWGGRGVERLLADKLPKWLERNRRVIPGFQAGSKALELINLYLGKPGQETLVTALSAVIRGESLELLTLRDILGSVDTTKGASWWEDVTGDVAVSPAKYVSDGTPDEAYGPDELIEELGDLGVQAIVAGEKGMNSASGEKELPSLCRDAACMGHLAMFYALRVGAALALGRKEHDQAAETMQLAIERYRKIVEIDGTHRGPFRLPLAGGTELQSLECALDALIAEHADALSGEFAGGGRYGIESIVAKHE